VLLQSDAGRRGKGTGLKTRHYKSRAEARPLHRGGERRAEFAGSEGVEGAEAGGDLLVGQAVFAVEPAKKICGGAVALLRIAFQTRRDEVAVGVAPCGHARHDVIDALLARAGPAEAIKTEAALAGADGLAQRRHLPKIHIFQAGGRGVPSRFARFEKIAP